MSTPSQVEIPGRNMTPLETQNLRLRTALFASLARTLSQGAGKVQAGTILAPGTAYGAATLSGAVVTGAGDCSCAKLTLSGDCLVRGVRLSEGLLVKANATVQVSDCIVLAPITVEAGGKVSVAGSRFDGNGYIDNAGAPANAISVGNVKTSSTAHVNVGTAIEV